MVVGTVKMTVVAVTLVSGSGKLKSLESSLSYPVASEGHEI